VTAVPQRVLVVNAGSSSIKLRLLDGDELAWTHDVPAPRGEADAAPVAEAVRDAGRIDAVGHRVVHGGDRFLGPVVVDDAVARRLAALTDLAPLHQPRSLAALETVRSLLPGTPQVACFDTAFHATIPPEAATYALPAAWRRRWPLRKFGFHGLSHAYVSRRAATMVAGAADATVATGGPRPAGEPGMAAPGWPAAARRTVTCHLGAGASLCAVLEGRSIDTTMGFTPLDGLVMATRSGSVDPGLVLWLEEHAGTPPAELAATLEHRSGLLGLAGTADMREVLGGERGGDAAAALAAGVYLHRLRSQIAAMTAALDGLDALVFTGGVGERSAEIRMRAADGLAYLGVELDPEANTEGVGDREIGAARATVRTLVVESREDLEIAGQVRQALTASRG
jgi:acetate kinase